MNHCRPRGPQQPCSPSTHFHFALGSGPSAACTLPPHAGKLSPWQSLPQLLPQLCSPQLPWVTPSPADSCTFPSPLLFQLCMHTQSQRKLECKYPCDTVSESYSCGNGESGNILTAPAPPPCTINPLEPYSTAGSTGKARAEKTTCTGSYIKSVQERKVLYYLESVYVKPTASEMWLLAFKCFKHSVSG